MNTTYKLTTEQKQAVIGQLLLGKTQVEVARKFGVKQQTIARYAKRIREAPRLEQVQQSTIEGWREDHKKAAIAAVTAGLTDQTDNYKRMAGGIQVLRGLGEYRDSALAVGFSVHFQDASLPEAVRDDLGITSTPTSTAPLAPVVVPDLLPAGSTRPRKRRS